MRRFAMWPVAHLVHLVGSSAASHRLVLRRTGRAVVAGLSSLVGIMNAAAEPIAWTGGAGNGSWHTPGNWDLNRIPTQTDDVTIGLDGTYTVSVTSSVAARTLVLGGTAGTQTLAINSERFDIRISGSVLPNGVLQLIRPDMQLWVITADNQTLGTLVNAGRIDIGTPGGPAGNRDVRCLLDNQGTITIQNGANLTLRYNTTNSGTINVTGGNLSSTVNTLTNTGTIAFGTGRSYSHTEGTLNLSGGTFGGGGAILNLNNVAVNHTADFHTADWGSLSISLCTINGPGQFVNDAPGGFNPVSVTFNRLVDNRATLSTTHGVFNAGLLNPAGSLLRILGNNSSSVTPIAGGFTNDGTVHLISRGASLKVTGGPLVNNGLIEVRREGTPQGDRMLDANIINYGTITNLDVSDLKLGAGNGTYTVTNSGTINVTGGNLSNNANFVSLTNTGTIAIAPGRTYSQSNGTTLNLNGGTFGGVGANLNLNNVAVNHTADFHTADWGNLSISACTFNGPGQFVNDAPGGFNPVSVTFNRLVDNRSTLSTTHGAFNAGLLNPAGSLLRILGDNNSSVTSIAGSFTNDGTVHLISRGATLNVTGGTLTNNGLIEVRREGTPQGLRVISFIQFNNPGTLTNFDVEHVLFVPNGPGASGTLANSGTINVLGGNMGNWTGINFGNNLTFTNNGTVFIAPGRTYRQMSGTINLTAGTFGGPGAHLDVDALTLTHTGDFHTGDWASIRCYGTIFGGPGKFVNDHPVGFLADCPSGNTSIFNALVENKSLFTSRGSLFTGGFRNPVGATLRVGSNAGGSQVTTRFPSGLTNDGVIEIVDWNAALSTIGPAPNFTMGTLTNSPTGQVHVRRLGTPQNVGEGGLRKLRSNILNHGTVTVHDTDLLVGEGNYFMLINNYGTFNLDGGNLVFGNGPLNRAFIDNYGVFNIGAGRKINNAPNYFGGGFPPLLFRNLPGAILSGSGTIFGGEGGPSAGNKFEINGVVRPGGQNAVGTLALAGNIFVPGVPGFPTDPADIGVILEIDVGADGVQPNDHFSAGLDTLTPQRGRYLSVNVLGSNLPPPGDNIQTNSWFPYIATNFTVFGGGSCLGCASGGGPGTACPGEPFVLAACPGPTITQQPQSQSPCAGDTVSISVVATGADPLMYQWQKINSSVDNLSNGPTGNGSTISGVNSPTLTISGLAVQDRGSYIVVVSDANGSRISTVATLVGGCVIDITAATPQPFLDSLTTTASTIVMQNVPDRPTLSMPALTGLGGAMHVIGNSGLTNLQAALLATIGGKLDIRNNPLLTDVTLPALTSVTGDLDVSGNTAATGIDLGSLGSANGSVTVSNNGAATAIDLSTLGSANGSVIVSSNGAATSIDLSNLGSANGSVTVSSNGAATSIDLSTLGSTNGSVTVSSNGAATAIDLSTLGSTNGSVTVSSNGAATAIDLSFLGGVGGDLNVTNNPAATVVGLGSLQTVVGSVSIRDNLALATVSMPLLTDVDGGVEVSGNTSATTIDFASLGSSGGAVTVTNNPGASTIDFASLGSSGGAVTVTNNPGASTIDFASLGSSGGAVTVTNNPSATNIALDTLTTVGGDLTLETQGQSNVDLSSAAVAGSTDINSTDATSVEVQTPGGTTSIEMCNGAACMDADLPDNAAPNGTPFAVLHVSGPGLNPQSGLDASGQPVTVDPVAAYTFTLGAPLQGPASLVFELTLAALTPPEQAAVLDAYAAGDLTLTVQGDTPGDLPTARAQCGPADPLIPDGCVLVGAFDVLGFQLPPGQTAGAEKLRLAALVSHFSTYSIAIIGAPCPPDFDNDGLLEVEDIFGFLNAWFAGLPASDFNGLGGISVQDIFDYLNAFFAGC